MLINANNLKKTFGEKTIFSDVAFSIDDKDKIGFIGVNGAGKSTLLKVLMGEIACDEGDVFKNKSLKIGYLEQYACADSDRTVYSETETVFAEACEIEKELDMIRWELENGGADDELILKQQRLNERFSELDGYYYKSRVKSCLSGLGFAESELNKKVAYLSGGQKTRVSLAKILLSDCNLLFLDEPTNHLDIEAVEWLEEFLKNYNGAFVVISHDRYFLDRITNRTFLMENEHLYIGNGNYTTFIKQREIDRLTEERNYRNTKREIERLEGIIEQQRRWNREKNIKTAESKQKVIDKLTEGMTVPQAEMKSVEFKFRALPGGGNEALRMEGVNKSYGESVLNNVRLEINKGDRVFLLGANGCGKTTLLKIICGSENADGGSVKIGANTKIGYYEQIQDFSESEKTILDEVWDEYPKKTETEIRSALAAFLFFGDDVYKEMKKLSGGERARVRLVKLILRPVNFLVLDEPTNHLDISSREALERALDGYDGTILTVSHDRYFINKLASRIVNFENGKLVNYNGGYEYFTEKYRKPEGNVNEEKNKNSDYAEQKRMASEKRKLETKIKRTEQRIAELEELLADINNKIMEAGSDYIKAAELSDEAKKVNAELEAAYAEWEELQ